MAAKRASDPLETRLRQFATEMLHEIAPDLNTEDRTEVIDEFLEVYGDSTAQVMEGFLTLSLHNVMDDDPDEESEEEDEKPSRERGRRSRD